MKKLTAKHIKEQDELVRSLESVADEIAEEVRQVNANISTARERIESLTTRYNDIVQDAKTFMSSIHDEQDSYFADRSSGWQEGDAGQSYESWMDEWNTDLEGLDEVELPDEVDEPELDAVSILRELPEQP